MKKVRFSYFIHSEIDTPKDKLVKIRTITPTMHKNVEYVTRNDVSGRKFSETTVPRQMLEKPQQSEKTILEESKSSGLNDTTNQIK
jgi:D-alanyl-D-alanine dipeptidase